jgi:hypothetical protein
MPRETFYNHDRKNSLLFTLEDVNMSGITKVYKFLNEDKGTTAYINSYTHRNFCSFLTKQKVDVGTKMLLTVNEYSDEVQYGEIIE